MMLSFYCFQFYLGAVFEVCIILVRYHFSSSKNFLACGAFCIILVRYHFSSSKNFRLRRLVSFCKFSFFSPPDLAVPHSLHFTSGNTDLPLSFFFLSDTFHNWICSLSSEFARALSKSLARTCVGDLNRSRVAIASSISYSRPLIVCYIRRGDWNRSFATSSAGISCYYGLDVLWTSRMDGYKPLRTNSIQFETQKPNKIVPRQFHNSSAFRKIAEILDLRRSGSSGRNGLLDNWVLEQSGEFVELGSSTKQRRQPTISRVRTCLSCLRCLILVW